MNRRIIFFFVLFVPVVAIVAFWRPIVRKQVEIQLEKTVSRWSGRAAWSAIEVRAFTVTIKELQLLPGDSSIVPVFACASLKISPDVKALFRGKKQLARLQVDSAAVYLAVNPVTGRWNVQKQGDPSANFDSDGLSSDGDELVEEDSSLVKPSTGRSFPRIVGLMHWMLEGLSGRAFPDVSVRRSSAHIVWANEDLRLDSVSFQLSRDSLNLLMRGPETRVNISGAFNDTSFNVSLKEPLELLAPLPDAFALRASAKEGFAALTKRAPGQFTFSGDVDQLVIGSKALAALPVHFGRTVFHSDLIVQGDSLNGSTHFSLSELDIVHIFSFKDGAGAPSTAHEFTLQPATAEAFRRSLPDALLGQLTTVDFSGRLGYHLELAIDFAEPDSVILQADLIREKFQLRNTGIDFQKLNGAFEQEVYDGLAVKRSVVIGRTNPFYTPLNDIPQHMIDAVLTSEDVRFYKHRGFSEGAFRDALSDNLKSKTFKRGASTISMQLVKNLFLTREKTLSRKFQEIVITWLMEESGEVSKDVLLEIYFNIIEWGPDVYGIGEAASYYFGKKASALTLEESLFLALIIPAPKRFDLKFRSGELRPGSIKTMNFVARRMAYFSFIPEDRASNLDWSRVVFSGRAGEVILPKLDLAEPSR